MKKIKNFLLICLVAHLSCLLAGCTGVPDETELMFETIEKRDYSKQSMPPGERIIVVNSQQDISLLIPFVSDDAINHLEQFDYEKSFAVGVFRGSKATSGYRVEIQRVVQRNDQITVYAQFMEPGRAAVNDEVTSPYQLVKIYLDSDAEIKIDRMILKQIPVTPTPSTSTH